MRTISWMILVLAGLSPLAANEPEWIELFDGRSLSGWRKTGGQGKYRVEDGAIVGTSVTGGPNTFLCTERYFGDFILELEFQVDPRLNSGIQIRSNAYPGYHGGTVHGYQIEIDPSDRAWSAGLYDESRRGWLANLTGNEAARKAFRQGEWNHYRIEARGDSIRTWINGVAAVDHIDSRTQTGFIALQVHTTNAAEPMEIRWRRIRIQDLGNHVWQPIFDGRSFAGWSELPGGEWAIEKGVIRGTSPESEKRHGLLLSDRTFRDFTVRADVRRLHGNSGFYFRAEPVSGAVGVHGFQAEIDGAKKSGGLYETGGRAWVVRADADRIGRAFRPGDWNDMTVSAHGTRIVTAVNGLQSAELIDEKGRREGRLRLQLHGGQKMHVEFRHLEELVPARGAGGELDRLREWTARKPDWAIALLAPGGDLSAWRDERKADRPIEWDRSDDGALTVKPGRGSIQTREEFGDFVLHLEFRVNEGAEQPPENRGNSGVYIQRRYELQILNSHGQKPRGSGCGAIYRFKAPDAMASLPAGEWQSYDILFRAARWSPTGEKLENVRITALQNGQVIHDAVIVPRKTGAGDREGPGRGPIKLQDHGNAVSFRNIWILPLN